MSVQDLQLKTATSMIKFALDLDPEVTSDWFVIDAIQKNICYEAEIATLLVKALRPGDVVVDIGANIGFFSVIMSRLVGDNGKVLAVEPSEENLKRFRVNKQLNEPCANNIHLETRPFWFEDAMVTFWHNSDHAGSSCLYDPGSWEPNVKSRANPRPEEMRAVTLDSFRLKPRLIKVDVEGAELQVLLGARETLIKQRPPFVVVELNPLGMEQMKYDTEYLRVFMRQFGYDLFFIHPDGTLPTLVPIGTEVKYVNDICVRNAMFSSIIPVGQVWTEAYE